MSRAECREELVRFVQLAALPAILGARELLHRHWRALKSTGNVKDEYLADLLNKAVVEEESRGLMELRDLIGFDLQEEQFVLDWLEKRAPAGPPSLDEQQLLVGRVLKLHDQTVTWVYRIGLALDSRFAHDEEYSRWRRDEDALLSELGTLLSSGAFPTLVTEVQRTGLLRPDPRTRAAPGGGLTSA